MEFRLQPAQGEIAAAEDGSASDIAICRLKPELQRKDEALCPAGFLMEHLRIHLGDADTARQIRECVRSLMPITDQLHAAETACSEEFTRKFAVTESADRVVDWLPLSEEVFVTRAMRLIATSRLKPELQRARQPLVRFQAKHRTEQLELLNRKLVLERDVVQLVEDAYGLSPDERRLLHETRPIRDPLDILEGKLAGKPAIDDVVVADD